MSKRTKAQAQTNLAAILGTITENEPPSSSPSVLLPQTTRKGDPAASGGALLLAIETIRPDANQPRNFFPADLYARLFSGADPVTVLSEWLRRAERDNRVLDKVNRLRSLADTIASHGLIQPISVRHDSSEGYLIVTGERRWWAHVLLTYEERVPLGQEAGTIKAVENTIRLEAIRAVQLIENLQREDLTIVESAKGLRALYEEVNRLERAPWRIIEEELGISEAYRKNIIRVLNLSDEVLSLVESHNLTEGAIRPIVQHLSDEPSLQLTAVRQLIAWQETGEYTVAKFQKFIDALRQQGQGDEKSAKSAFDAEAWASMFSRQIGGAFKLLQVDAAHLGELTKVLRQDDKALQQWQEIRAQMDEVFGIF